VLSGALVAATLAIWPTFAGEHARTGTAAASFGMAGDLSRAAGQRNSADAAATSRLTSELRTQRARAQAASNAAIAHHALVVARQVAARRAAAAKAAAAARSAAVAAPVATPSAAPVPVATPTQAPVTPAGSPQQIAMAMLSSYGWPSGQFGCLDNLWQRESGWNPLAENTSSGAYGIPQALPGSKMASAGADWATDAATQIRWGLGYIKSTYGSPCAAWGHETAYGWY
jgi:hypothetical protein